MFHGCTPTVMVLASKVECKQRMLVDTVNAAAVAGGRIVSRIAVPFPGTNHRVGVWICMAE